MPRKVNNRIDYYDYYDDYDAYEDFDDDFGMEENDESPEAIQETTKPGVWHCAVCTFDNDESMPACEICGVLRNPLVNISSNNSKGTVDGMCKDSGASIMAKSLFASLPQWSPKKAVICQQQNDDFVMEEGNKFHKLGIIQRNFLEFIKAYSSHNHYRIDIAPFKFDFPSPDDLVTNGMRSSRMVSKGNPAKPTTSTKMLDGSSLSMPIGREERVNESNCSSVTGGTPESFTSSFGSISLNTKSDRSKNATARRAKTHVQYKPEKWMLPVQSEEGLTQLNLAIVGHVDSGKSTLSGRLLHLLGRISQKSMHKYEKEAKEQGKGSFAYAWALDESTEERERGVTMTVAVAYFDSKNYHVVVLDSPDASIGSFEVGMDSTGGQTREHAQLIRSFGVDQVIVAVNKMDVVKYSKERFDLIKVQLGSFLRSCGFKDSSVSWIPLSAMENQNLVTRASDARLLSWYQGPNLLDAIDSFKSPTRDFSKPLIMPICDVVKSHSMGQVSACGKLEAGALRSGSKVLVMPFGDVGTVRSLERDSHPCSIARAGDSVAISLQGIDGSRVMAGGVVCHPDFPVAVATHLELKVLILEVSTPILIGSQLEFHIHHAKESASVVRILSLLDSKTGKVTRRAPRCLISKQHALIEVALHSAVCADEFSSCRALGRVFLRASGRTVAVGIVTRLIEP
ncbi:uncharacterized protein LOC131152222 isoform X3 [Malania oleifera]|uniref:uncharacterized protein LOC131152222 isoform X3 n=1 Tax=Malania oleifera TaxID=397392 RepID=UPI0025AE758A|nr:uncharacterized protein LOC131152222 isoform X3 [Malania oleifera]